MKKKHVITLVAFALVLAALVLVLVTKREPEQTAEKIKYESYPMQGAFNTTTTVYGYATSGEEFMKVVNDAWAQIYEYHQLFDIYYEYEGINNLCTINKLNENGEHDVVKVDRKIIDMLLYAKRMYTVTNGKMNIAMGSVLSIWHDYRSDAIDNHFGFGELPPMDMLQEAAKHTDINDLIIDEENSTVYLADPKMKLDVGAIAKGYAVEMVARNLESKGITNYVLDVGRNLRTLGTKASGEKWMAGVINPNYEEANEPYYLAYVGFADQSLVSSGDYERFYMVGSKRYHHIIDPDTLMPSEGIRAVSIVCDHSGDGDGLSTAIFCMTVEEGLALIESLDGVEAMWLLSDGTIVRSSGFSALEVELE